MNYQDFIKGCENTFNITKPLYTKTYDNFLTIIKNYLLSKGYAAENGDIIIPENDQAFTSLFNVGANVFTNIMIDSSLPTISFRQSNFLGVDARGLSSTINAMSLISLQKSCEENLEVLKTRYPMREYDVVKLCLFMILFYDLKLYKLAALTASIMFAGGRYDISNN